MDLPDDYFDAYFSNSVINFTKNPTKVMSEAYRTLAKGGRAGFSLLGRSAGSNFTQVTKEIVERLGFDQIGMSWQDVINAQDMQRMAEEAGFTGFKYTYTNAGVLFHDADEAFVPLMTQYQEIYAAADDQTKKHIRDVFR